MRKTLLLLFIASVVSTASAQIITFRESIHEFGTFDEALGEVSHQFQFTNTGDAPLIINRVTASCGCTTPKWTKQPIEPGKTGVIDVKYSATNRPGAFNKSINVSSNSKDGQKTLYIKGVVSAKKQDQGETYPITVGDLKLKADNLNLKDVGKNEEKTAWIEVTNKGTEAIELSELNVPSHIMVQSNPVKLAPNQLGMIFVTFYGKKVDDWGTRKDRFTLVVNSPSKGQTSKEIEIDSEIVERFSLRDSQKDVVPRIVFSEPVVTIGRVKKREKKSQIIEIRNEGSSTLIIRKVTPSSNAIVVSMDKKEIIAKGSIKVKVMLDTSKTEEKVISETISIISNDPVATQSILQVKATTY